MFAVALEMSVIKSSQTRECALGFIVTLAKEAVTAFNKVSN